MHRDKPLYTMMNHSGKVVQVKFFSWGEAQRDEVEIGVIDQRAIDAFTRGQCHALALALHEKEGWDIYGLFSKYNFEHYIADIQEGLTTPSHVVVRSDKDEYIVLSFTLCRKSTYCSMKTSIILNQIWR